VARLSLVELEQVFDHIVALLAQRKAPHVLATESVLLTRINEGLPSAIRNRMALRKVKRVWIEVL
jgi:hypothetical protein